MKVTQKEFDAKRKELADVQENLDLSRGSHRKTTELISLNTKTRIMFGTQIILLEDQEANLIAWLEDVWIEEDLSFNMSELKGQALSRNQLYDLGFSSSTLRVRLGGLLGGKGFYLGGENIDWRIEKDDVGETVLVPTKKP